MKLRFSLFVVCSLFFTTSLFASPSAELPYFQPESPAVSTFFAHQDQNFEHLSTPSHAPLGTAGSYVRSLMVCAALFWLYRRYGARSFEQVRY